MRASLDDGQDVAKLRFDVRKASLDEVLRLEGAMPIDDEPPIDGFDDRKVIHGACH